jgi:hypothetical protein
LIPPLIPTTSEFESSMNNLTVTMEATEESNDGMTEFGEVSLPPQDLEVNVEPMDDEEEVSPFPVFLSFPQSFRSCYLSSL